MPGTSSRPQAKTALFIILKASMHYRLATALAPIRFWQAKGLCRDNQRLLATSHRLIAISRRKLNPCFGLSGSSDDAAGGPPVSWADALRTLVRDKLAVGDLFALIDAHCWGGPATGESCVVCGEKIDGGVEFEVDGPSGSVFTHLVCYSIWHGESEGFPRSSTT